MIARPRVHATLRRLNYRDYLAALTSHRVDVTFVRPDPGEERLDAIRLSAEPRVAVLLAAHRLKDATQIAAEEVLDEPFVAIADDVPRSAGGGCLGIKQPTATYRRHRPMMLLPLSGREIAHVNTADGTPSEKNCRFPMFGLPTT